MKHFKECLIGDRPASIDLSTGTFRYLTTTGPRSTDVDGVIPERDRVAPGKPVSFKHYGGDRTSCFGAWLILVVACAAVYFAVFLQSIGTSVLVPILGLIAGIAFSALTALVLARMRIATQIVMDALEMAKAQNPVTPELGHKIRIKRELLIDLGMRTDCGIVMELDDVAAFCDGRWWHGFAANPLYHLLRQTALLASIQSLFLPRYLH